jgi:hypothetical protein
MGNAKQGCFRIIAVDRAPHAEKNKFCLQIRVVRRDEAGISLLKSRD